jgi:hypothetical protein
MVASRRAQKSAQSWWGKSIRWTIGIVAGVLFSHSVSGQSGAGSIQGTVQDSAGSVISGATIRVVKSDTGAVFTTTTNSAGFYTVPSLFTGDYSITFSATSMKQYETSVSLQDAQNAVISPKLSPGSVTEQVTVKGDTIQLATYDSGTISAQLDANRINELPMNGREVLTLAGDTTPGLEDGGQRANGNMPEGLEYTQDGAPVTNRGFGGEGNSTQAQLPDPDSVQEVKIETANSSAQFATPGTAIITTKSGTNQLHGSYFETARNNALGIAKSRQDLADFSAPHYVRNEFGASLGGPIVLPKLYNGKDKSFFFFAYERFSLRSFTSELVKVPTVAMRNGDYSGLVSSAGVLQVMYDPATTNPVTSQRMPFANNQIPMSRQSPLAKALYAITPLPSTQDNPLVQPNLSTPGISNQTVPNVSFRLDHVANQNNRLYLRFTGINQTLESLRNNPTNSPATIAGAGLPAGASGLTGIPISTYSGSVGYTHVFSPTFFAETIVSQQWFRQYFSGGPASNVNVEQDLGLPNNFAELGFPAIVGTNASPSSPTMSYGGTQFNYGISQILTNIDENLTRIVGRHQLQFGGRYRHERFGYLPDRSPDQVNFGAFATADLDPESGVNYTPLANTGIADADLFLGAAFNYTTTLNASFQHYREQEIDSYFQDNFHISKNLIINGGLRWEIHPAPYAKDGLLQSFDLVHKAIVLQNPLSYYVNKGYTTQTIVTNLQNLGMNFENPEQAGLPSSLIYNNDFVFSPRIGVAYTLFGGKYGTVLRGGYGRYIYPVPIRNSVKITAPDQPFSASYSQNYVAGDQNPNGDMLPNYLLREPQPVVAGENSGNVVDSGNVNDLLPGINETTLDPHYHPDIVTQVNATIEQPVKGGSVLRISYLLDHGQGLDQEYDYNNFPSPYVWETTTGLPIPGGRYANTAMGPYDQTLYGSFDVLDQKNGWSNDNSLQVNFQRQFHHGYAYQLFYVYSRAFRVGGNYFRDSVLYPGADFAPGGLPVDPGPNIENPSHALDRFENYILDSAIPEHHIQFNGIVDLPLGRGKYLLGHTNRLVDELVGGYQVAFDGLVVSQQFQVNSGNWGQANPIKVYKQHGITDCRSGVCHPENLWFNGYIAPQVRNEVTGLPSDYAPYQSPIDTVTGTNYAPPIKLQNGQVVSNVTYAPGPSVNPFTKTFIHGPFNYNADISLFKVFPIKESVSLRVNVDAFNALNIQGYNNPNTTDGTQSFTSSYWTPRQLQLSARLTF